jgi:hypothetical protein
MAKNPSNPFCMLYYIKIHPFQTHPQLTDDSQATGRPPGDYWEATEDLRYFYAQRHFQLIRRDGSKMQVLCFQGDRKKRANGFEPSTSSLGSWHSTTELRPQFYISYASGVIVQKVPLVCQTQFSVRLRRMGQDVPKIQRGQGKICLA